MLQCLHRGMPGIPGSFLWVSSSLQPYCKSTLHARGTTVLGSLDLLKICYLLQSQSYFSAPLSCSRLLPLQFPSPRSLWSLFLSLSATELSIFHAPEELVTSSHKFQLNLRRYEITNNFWSIRSLTRHPTSAEICWTNNFNLLTQKTYSF